MARAKRAPANKGVGIRIRMYRVGFGDFFLVSFGDQHVVIDCGVFKGTSGTGDLGSIEGAIDNLAKETDGKLALIVMTHRHADHIAGFGRFADKFRGFTVDDVWMPIWETQYDPRAVKFQAELTAIAVDLQDHLDARLAADKDVDSELYHRIGNATGDEPATATGKSRPGGVGKNAVALDLLKTAFNVKPQYLKAGDTPTLSAGLRATGLSARVLGPPPIDDIDMLKLMNLKKGVGQYLAMASDSGQRSSDWRPFASAWYAPVSEISPAAFSEWMPNRGAGLDESARKAAVDQARHRLEKVLHQSDPDALDLAAKALDSFLNNQSLVVLFTFHGKNLLFVGDAQGGNWEHWLYETDDPTSNPTSPLARSAKDILDDVDVYKVGHHGSTNATPIVVSKEIREGAVALCSTEKGVYGKTEATAVPLQKLMDALDQRVGLVRTDQLEIEVDGETKKAQVTRPTPTKTDGVLEPGALWFDYTL